MSFYDDASLVLIPSGYKAGKVYSQKPLSTNGELTFTRASHATRVNVNGYVEKARTNNLTYSNTLSNAVWSNYQTSQTGGHADRDGGTDAWKYIENGSTNQHYLQQATDTVTGVGVMSVYAKYSGRHIQLRVFGIGGGKAYANFDLQNGTTSNSGGTQFVASNITSVGNGWYRCEMALYNSAAYRWGLHLITTPTAVESESYTGDGVSGAFIQDCQLENGLVATDYIETTTAAVTVGIYNDVPRLDYSGGASCPALLLEPQRTNILAYSEGMFDSSNFVKVNGVVAEGQQTDLNGTNTAVKLSNFIQNAARLDYTASLVAVDGKTYTYSAYYKGSGDIRINVSTSTGVGGSGEKTITLTDEWVRHSITATFSSPTGNVKSHLAITRTTNNDAEVYLCFAQIEEGSYPTSYIPTYGSTVTRVNGYTNTKDITALSIGNSHTILFDADLNSVDSNKIIATLYNSVSAQVMTFRNFGGAFRAYNNLDAAYPISSQSSESNKWVIRIDGTSYDLFRVSGGNPEKVSGTLTTARNLGYFNLLGDHTEWTLNKFLIFNSALTDAECNDLVK